MSCGNTTHSIAALCSLRWHYPNQVIRVRAAYTLYLSPLAAAPLFFNGYYSKLKPFCQVVTDYFCGNLSPAVTWEHFSNLCFNNNRPCVVVPIHTCSKAFRNRAYRKAGTVIYNCRRNIEKYRFIVG